VTLAEEVGEKRCRRDHWASWDRGTRSESERGEGKLDPGVIGGWTNAWRG
jgi:hypothetical protein